MVGRAKATADRRAEAVVDRFVDALERWWWQIRWWSPEGKTWRAWQDFSPIVIYEVSLISRAQEADVEEAVYKAFLALHHRHLRGHVIRNVRTWAVRYALTVMPAHARPTYHAPTESE